MKTQTYKTVAALLSDPKRWTQGAIARDARGRPIDDPRSKKAVCWCAAGAIDKIYGRGWEAQWNRLSLMINNASVGCWNDTHTHAEVLALVRKAGI